MRLVYTQPDKAVSIRCKVLDLRFVSIKKKLDFVFIPPSVALEKFTFLHGKQKTIQSYIWVTKAKRCWEARGLDRQDQLDIAENRFQHPTRDLTPDLNNWAPIIAALA